MLTERDCVWGGSLCVSVREGLWVTIMSVEVPQGVVNYCFYLMVFVCLFLLWVCAFCGCLRIPDSCVRVRMQCVVLWVSLLGVCLCVSVCLHTRGLRQ